MKELKKIDLATAENMSEGRLTVEIGKHSKYLQEKFGMNNQDACEFISNVLNLGAAMQEYFDKKKPNN